MIRYLQKIKYYNNNKLNKIFIHKNKIRINEQVFKNKKIIITIETPLDADFNVDLSKLEKLMNQIWK